MTHTLSRFLLLLVCAIGAFLVSTTMADEQDSSSAKPVDSAGDLPKEAPPQQNKAPRGRLPNYYAAVVSDRQRRQIYEIQAEYRPKIEAIQAQLDALRKEQADRILAVLTPEQVEQIEQAKSKRKKTPAKPKQAPPQTPPAEQQK